MGAKKKPTDRLSAADAGVDGSRVGEAGARCVVRGRLAAAGQAGGPRIEDSGGDSVEQIVAFLAEKGVV